MHRGAHVPCADRARRDDRHLRSDARSRDAGLGTSLSSGTPGVPNGIVSAHQLTLDCTCPANLNPDGEIDAEDLAILLGGWGTCP